MKKRILVFCDFYLPGFRSGGGMRTVVNLVDRFSDRYDFFVATRNYDSPAEKTPYKTVKTGEWNTVGNAQVYYLATADITSFTCASLAREVAPDLVYLNSTFATTCVKFLMARAKGLVPFVPVILAPCGEFSRRALSLKPLKKKAYLAYAKARRLFDGLLWKASNETEIDEIRAVLGPRANVMAAPDLAPAVILPDLSPASKPAKRPGEVRFVSLSRVVPIKNIRFFLELLGDLEEGDVTLEIVGPIEDVKYWGECEAIIRDLPANIKVDIAGAVSYEKGLEHLVGGHFFVLPSLSENFGYAFIESLAAGTPLLISDRTMWSAVDARGCGWALPLEQRDAWKQAIRDCVAMDSDSFGQMSAAGRTFSAEWLAAPEREKAVADVLDQALRSEARV